MPAVSTISLVDGKATPVTHAFDPSRTAADMAMYEDRSAAQYIGYNKLTLSLRRPTGQSRVANRNLGVYIKLEMPILETLGTSDSGITPAPTVAYRPFFEATFTLPERSLLSERRDLRIMAAGLLNQLAVADLVEKLSVPF